MNLGRLAPISDLILAAVIASTLIASPHASAKAETAPSAGCRPVSKIEYNAAKQQFLLHNRYGMYVRTGRWWRRHYWFCHYT